MKFLTDCIGWPRNEIEALHDMIEQASSDIGYAPFAAEVGEAQLKKLFPQYDWEPAQEPTQGWLTMRQDWHISYHRSTLLGTTVMYLVHSAIEFVFAPDNFEWNVTR